MHLKVLCLLYNLFIWLSLINKLSLFLRASPKTHVHCLTSILLYVALTLLISLARSLGASCLPLYRLVTTALCFPELESCLLSWLYLLSCLAIPHWL